MTDLKQAMLQAAVMLKVGAPAYNTDDVLEVLEAALALPQPEPVGVLWQHEETGRTDFLPLDEGRVTESRWGRVGPVYLHPPQRQPLTGEELDDLSRTMDRRGQQVSELALQSHRKSPRHRG